MNTSQQRAKEIQTAIHKLLPDATKLKQVKQAVEKFKEEYNKHANEEICQYYLPFTIRVPKELFADETKLQNLPVVNKISFTCEFNRPHVYTYLTGNCPPYIHTDIVFYEDILDYLDLGYKLFSRIKLNFDTKKYLTKDRSVYLVVPNNKIDLTIIARYLLCRFAPVKLPCEPPRQRVHSAPILKDDELNRVSEALPTIQEIITEYIRCFNMYMIIRMAHGIAQCNTEVLFTVDIPIQIFYNEHLILELKIKVEIETGVHNKRKNEYYVAADRHYYIPSEGNSARTLKEIVKIINGKLDTNKVRTEQLSKQLRTTIKQTISELGFNLTLLKYGIQTVNSLPRVIHAPELIPIHTGIIFVPQIKRPRIITIDDLSQKLRIVAGRDKQLSDVTYLDELDLFAIDCGDLTYKLGSYSFVDDSKINIEAIQYKV